jgi:hypothetical protein
VHRRLGERKRLAFLQDVMERYASELTSEHQNLLNAMTKLLEHPAEAVRKRACVTLGSALRGSSC